MKTAALPPLSRSFSCKFHVVQEGLKCLSSTPSNFISKASDCVKRMKINRRSETAAILSVSDKTSRFRTVSSSMLQKEVLCPVWYASESDDCVGNHQRSVETYIKKLKSEAKQGPCTSANEVTELEDRSNQLREGLMSLERYLGSLKGDTKSEGCIPSTSGRSAFNVAEDAAALDTEGGRTGEQKGFSRPRYKRGGFHARRKSASSPLYDETESGHLYLISMLLSVNIAVFLFEIASPVKNSDYNLSSLPLMYGAKINDLILGGEWWRLVTPMFLHSGLLHIVLSSWVLLSFGPRVCKGYGSFTFLLIYILGGISGNFSSFLHTAEPTVGGSGPVFAVIGAWLIYQIHNKNVDEKEVSEAMFQKAIVATALSCVLSNFGPIDNWTNLAAVVSGIIYGYFTSPVVQVDDAPSNGLQETTEEETTILRQPANPCKSLLIFAVCLSALSSLLFLPKTPLDQLDLEELLRL